MATRKKTPASNLNCAARAVKLDMTAGDLERFCPAHDNRLSPALSVSEKGTAVLVHCHAGCSQEAVIDALRARGLWSGLSAALSRPE